jgi:hypothetical protein
MNSFGKRNFMQPMGRLMGAWLLFLGFLGEEGERDFFVPNVFSSGSQDVPIRFPTSSSNLQCVP